MLFAVFLLSLLIFGIDGTIDLIATVLMSVLSIAFVGLVLGGLFLLAGAIL